MALTELAIRQAKPRDKKYRLADGGGLNLEVLPSGGKCWRLRYRHPQTQKARDLSIGTYPTVGLKDARQKAVDAKEQLSRGIDPSSYKQVEKLSRGQSHENSFAAIANEWLLKQQHNLAEATAQKHRTLLDKELLPYLGVRPIADLETWELLGTLNRIVDRGAMATAHKCRGLMNQICRYAKQTGRSKHNPAIDLAGAIPQKNTTHRAAITDPQQFGKLLVAIDAYKGSLIIRTLLALAPLLFQRPGELASMEWSELDLEAGYWHIPQEKKKERNQREDDHTVPLPRQALELLRDIQPVTGHRQYVFPNQRDYSRHARSESVNKALRDLGFDTVTTHCFHGFRASARTMLDEQLGLRVEWIEHQLAHTVRDPLGRAYNRTKHLPQRVEMMQRWANYLDNLKAQTLAGNVITANFGQG